MLIVSNFVTYEQETKLELFLIIHQLTCVEIKF